MKLPLTGGIMPEPYYILPEGSQPPPQPMSPAFLETAIPPFIHNSVLFLTPACVHRAKATGEYRFVTFSEALQGMDGPPDSPSSLANALGTFGGAPSTEAFLKRLDAARVLLMGAEASCRLADGRVLDMQKYYAEVEADADKWAAAIPEQFKAYSTEFFDHVFKTQGIEGIRRGHKGLTADDETYKKIEAAYFAEIDADTRAVIASSRVQILIDYFHERKESILVSESQKIIAIHPEFLDKKGAMGVICERAVKCAMQGKEDLTIPWSLAELEIYCVELPSQWKTGPKQTLGAVYVRARRQPQLFRETLPVTYSAYHQHEMGVKAEAHRILQGTQPPPEYKATDTKFTVNPDVLTTPQQEYFSQLNNIIAKLGVTPKEFDTQFRFCVNQLKRKLSGDMAKIRGQILQPHEILDEAEILPKTPASFASNPMPRNYHKDTDLSRTIVALSISFQDQLLGFMGMGLPPKPTPTEKRVYENWALEIQKIIMKLPAEATPAVAEAENILQSYAAGFRLMPLLRHVKMEAVAVDRRLFTLPPANQIFEVAIHNAIIGIAQKQGLTGERGEAVRGDLEALEQISQNAFQWPDELAQSEHQARAIKDRSRAREAEEARRAAEAERIRAQEEAARLAREAAQALAPAPYTIALVTAAGAGTAFGRISKWAASERWKDIRNPDDKERARQLSERMKYLHQQEIEPLRGFFDTKLPGHKELAEMLFDETTLKRAEYGCVGESKMAVHSDAFRQRAGEALFTLFTQPTEGLTDEQRQRYEGIQERIFQSPALIVSMLGSDGQLRDLRSTHERLLAKPNPSDAITAELNQYHQPLISSLLGAIGIETPAAPSAVIPAITQTEIAAQETDPTESESSEPATAIRETQDGISIFEPVVVKTLAVEPELPNLAEQAVESKTDIIRAAALEEAKQFFIADLGGVIARAQDQGLHFFECTVDVNKPAMPIVFRFSKEVIGDDKVPRRAQITHTITSHGSYFRHAGLALRVEDATDLKHALQSAVMREEKNFFVPPVFTRKSGVVDVAYDAPLPRDAYNVEKHWNAPTVDGSGGLCSLIIEAEYQSPYRKIKGQLPEQLHISIPLGIARKPGSPEEQASINSEIEERKFRVLEILDNVKERDSITKGDLVRELERWVSERDQTWEKWSREKLPGFDKDRILHLGPEGNGQKITLAPVSLALAPGGDNPSWVMNIQIYAGNKKDEDRGTLVYNTSVNLHTRDYDLAQNRARISLLGDKRSSDGKYGLLPMIQHYMQEHPQDQWRGTNPTQIGEYHRLEYFFDDMRRYEHDVRMYPRLHYNEDGTATLTLSVGRSNDLNKPETLFINKVDQTRVPLIVHMKLPKTLVDEGKLEQRLDAFLVEAGRGFGWKVADFYSSVNPDDGERQPVKRYSVARIKNTMLRAIEGSFETFFGQSLPKNWENESATWIDVVKGDRIRRTRSANKPKPSHADRVQQTAEDRLRGG